MHKKGLKPMIWAFIALAATIAICTAVILIWRWRVTKIVDSVDQVLERVLAGELAPPGVTNSEDRISSLAHKANRITSMLIEEAAAAKTEKMTVQGFISDMSHQMKTPLAGIAMYTELLLEGNLTAEDSQEFLSRVKISADKLQWMTDSLIKLSRLEAGAIALVPMLAGVRQTISEAITLVLAEADRRNIKIEVAKFEDVQLHHDRKWTVEALVNILDNAVKYSKDGGEIAIRVEALQQYTKIIIADNGIGIPKSEWNKIFTRFYRGKNVKDKEGVGLGLYLARVIMESQDGYVLVDSAPGQGSTFSLFLRS